MAHPSQPLDSPAGDVVLFRRWSLARWVRPATTLAVLGAALVLLAHELRDYHYREITHALAAIGHERMLTALALTAIAYAILPAYDAMALIYADVRLPI